MIGSKNARVAEILSLAEKGGFYKPRIVPHFRIEPAKAPADVPVSAGSPHGLGESGNRRGGVLGNSQVGPRSPEPSLALSFLDKPFGPGYIINHPLISGPGIFAEGKNSMMAHHNGF